MPKDRAGQSVGTRFPKKCRDLVTMSGPDKTWSLRVRSSKAAKKNRVSYYLLVCERVRGTDLMFRTFWITELHRSTNSSDQLYSKFFFFFLDGCTLHLVWNKSQLPTWRKYLFYFSPTCFGPIRPSSGAIEFIIFFYKCSIWFPWCS